MNLRRCYRVIILLILLHSKLLPVTILLTTFSRALIAAVFMSLVHFIAKKTAFTVGNVVEMRNLTYFNYFAFIIDLLTQNFEHF